VAAICYALTEWGHSLRAVGLVTNACLTSRIGNRRKIISHSSAPPKKKSICKTEDKTLDHGRQPARQNDREPFELLGIITSL
jgi:hypothetical protein